ncbi:MAG: YbaN family protein [Bacteroidales bacterium]|nr:YbaN family protein [Bacteroidales bacterium]
MKWFLITLGTISVGLGFLGIFVPLLPTTAFLLLAAWCYARSSRRFYNWLLNNRIFGKYITSYLEGKGVPVQTKIWSVGLLWITILSSIIIFVENIYIEVLLILIAIGVSVHIIKLPNYKASHKDKIGKTIIKSSPSIERSRN